MSRVHTVEFNGRVTRRRICKDENGVLFIRLKGHKWKVVFKYEKQINHSQISPLYDDVYTITEPYEEG